MLKPFSPGVSGNPAGRPANAGLSVAEWFNQLKHRSPEEIEAIAKDRSQPAEKIMAAVQWVNGCTLDKDKTGRPIAGEAVDRIMDRTAGKPIARHEHSGPDGGPIVQVQVQTDLNSCADYFERFVNPDRT